MRKFVLTTLLMIGVSFVIACGEIRGGEYRGREPGSREENPINRNARIERLLPEDGVTSPSHLGALIEAMRTVRPDIPKEELPLNGNAVRRVLNEMSVRDLDRVEAILPRIEKRRQAEGRE
jgi:hypothetical protein